MHCTSHSAWVPPGEPGSHHWERGCNLGEEESKVAKAPSPTAVHSQALRQGVRLILLSRSRQTSPAVVAGMAKLVLHHGEPGASLFSLRSTLSCVLGCPISPKEGHLPHGCMLSKSSACKSCSQLCHTPAWSHSSSSWHPTTGSPWNNPALPPASLPRFPSRLQFPCLPPAPQPRTGEGFPRLLLVCPVSPSCGWLLSWGYHSAQIKSSWYCCLLLPACKYFSCHLQSQFTAYVNRQEFLLVCALKAHFHPSWSHGEAQTHDLVAFWFFRSKQ